MYKSIFAILVALCAITVVVSASEMSIVPVTDAHAQLQEIYAQNLALSPDMTLPTNFISNHAQLQEIYAQNLALSPDVALPADFVSSPSQ